MGDTMPSRTPPITPKVSEIPVGDTPAKVRSTAGPGYRSGALEEVRDAVLEDLGYDIPELPMRTFLSGVFPKFRFTDKIINKVAEDLGCKNSDWAEFNPRVGTEAMVFSSLETIFKKIVTCKWVVDEAKRQRLKRIAGYVDDHDRAPTSTRDDATRPDSFLELLQSLRDKISSSDAHTWYDIFLPCEFKLKENDKCLRDDVRKILWSMHHILRSDPCRRFTYGLTIEGRRMRLWYSSRAMVLVSEAFDFVKEYSCLIRIFLTISFATQNELGWDPTIVFDKRLGKHVVQIQANKYTIINTISDAGADALVGRGCRVFLAEAKGGRRVAIKDVWINEDRKLEHEIWENIRDAIKHQFGEKRWAEVKAYFFTYEAFGLVDIDGEDDTSRLPLSNLSDDDIQNADRFHLPLVATSSKPKQSSVGTVPHLSDHHHTRALPPAPKSAEVQHRKHYRTVMKEVGEPLHNLRKLGPSWEVICHIMRVVALLSQINYVHRDISTGNSYYHEGQVIMGDLEYAKVIGTGSTHEIRTGTRDFIAIEAAQREYFYRPDEEILTFEEDLAALSLEPINQPSVSTRTPAFFHNPIHESESVWWMGLKTLFGHTIRHNPEGQWRAEDQIRQFYIMFPSTADYTSRYTFFHAFNRHRDPAKLSLVLEFRQLFKLLTLIHRLMVGCYKSAEKIPAINNSAWGMSYFDRVSATLEVGRKYCGDIDLVPLSEYVTP